MPTRIAVILLMGFLSGCFRAPNWQIEPDVVPPEIRPMTAAQAVRMLEQGIPITPEMLGAEDCITRPAFIDPEIGPQLIPHDSMPTYSLDDLFEHQIRMGFGPDPNLETDFTTTVQVRPPTFEWWLGWNLFLEGQDAIRPSDVSVAAGLGREISQVYTSRIWIPVDWGCAEVRLQFRGTYTSCDTPRAISSFSRILIAGVCPDPMPERIPLATPELVAAPEPGIALLLLAGVALILFVELRRTRRFRKAVAETRRLHEIADEMGMDR